jgi:hypothetical protein
MALRAMNLFSYSYTYIYISSSPNEKLPLILFIDVIFWTVTKFLFFFFLISNVVARAQSIERLGHGLDDRGSVLGRGRDFFSPRHRVQNGSGVHAAHNPVGNEVTGSFLGA